MAVDVLLIEEVDQGQTKLSVEIWEQLLGQVILLACACFRRHAG